MTSCFGAVSTKALLVETILRKCGKMQTRINPNTDNFYAVFVNSGMQHLYGIVFSNIHLEFRRKGNPQSYKIFSILPDRLSFAIPFKTCLWWSLIQLKSQLRTNLSETLLRTINIDLGL